MKPLFIKKNGTVSKVSGIVMNLIPSYTLAEYNALTHKPLFWVRTDEDYAQISSEDVSYGSGSVKDALDGLTGSSFGTLVDLSSTSESSPYVAPSDGVIFVVYNYAQTGYVYLSVSGLTLYTSKQHSNAAFTWSFPVKKGMSIYMGQTSVTNPQFVFVPYV